MAAGYCVILGGKIGEPAEPYHEGSRLEYRRSV